MSEKEKDKINKAVDNEIFRKIGANTVANDQLGVTQKYNRNTYDNGYKKQVYKKKHFGDRKTKKDYLTGETVHSSTEAAKAKYRDKAYTKHTSDVDHINSLKKVHDTLKKNPFLTDEDIKKIANDESNYRMTMRKLNRAKQERSNLELACKKDSSLSMNTKGRLVMDQAKASSKMTLNVTKSTVKNVSKEFTDGAAGSLQGAVIPLMVEAVNNLILVANNEKDLSEASKDTAGLTAKVAITGGGLKVATTGLTNVLKNSEKEVLKKMGESNQVGKVLVVALIVKDSTVKYMNGEISGEEFFKEIGEKGVDMIAGSIGYTAGQFLIPIPVVGGLIGSMIVSLVCEDIYRTAMTINDYKIREENAKQIAMEAKAELDKQKVILKNLVEKELSYINIKSDEGVKLIYDGLMNNDANTINYGLQAFLDIIDKELAFKSDEEFEDFFMDEDSVLVF